MTGNPEIDKALADLEETAEKQRGALDELNRIVRGWRRITAIALVAVVLALGAVGAVAVGVHHSADQRAELRCAETVDRTAAIAEAVRGAVDDVMGAIADQIATDAETVEAVETIRDRVDRRLAIRFDDIPTC